MGHVPGSRIPPAPCHFAEFLSLLWKGKLGKSCAILVIIPHLHGPSNPFQYSRSLSSKIKAGSPFLAATEEVQRHLDNSDILC